MDYPMSVSPCTLRMFALTQLIAVRQAHTDALLSDLADIISSGKEKNIPSPEIVETICGENQTADELRQILSHFYAKETEFLVKLGVCEVVPVGSAEEAQVEAAEILTRAKGH